MKRQSSFSRLSIVGEHEIVTELDARLHDYRHHTIPGPVEAQLGENPAGRLDRLPDVVYRSGLDTVLMHLCAAGWRDLRPDNVAEHGQVASVGVGLLGGAGKRCRPAGHDFRVKSVGRRIIFEMHAGIEMDLRIAGQHALTHKRCRLLHGLGSREVFPDQWAEVVAP